MLGLHCRQAVPSFLSLNVGLVTVTAQMQKERLGEGNHPFISLSLQKEQGATAGFAHHTDCWLL